MLRGPCLGWHGAGSVERRLEWPSSARVWRATAANDLTEAGLKPVVDQGSTRSAAAAPIRSNSPDRSPARRRVINTNHRAIRYRLRRSTSSTNRRRRTEPRRTRQLWRRLPPAEAKRGSRGPDPAIQNRSSASAATKGRQHRQLQRLRRAPARSDQPRRLAGRDARRWLRQQAGAVDRERSFRRISGRLARHGLCRRGRVENKERDFELDYPIISDQRHHIRAGNDQIRAFGRKSATRFRRGRP